MGSQSEIMSLATPVVITTTTATMMMMMMMMIALVFMMTDKLIKQAGWHNQIKLLSHLIAHTSLLLVTFVPVVLPPGPLWLEVVSMVWSCGADVSTL